MTTENPSTDTGYDTTVVNGPATHGYVQTARQPSTVGGSARGSLSRVPASLVVLVGLMGAYTRGGLLWLRHLSPIDAEDIRLLVLVCVLAAMFVLICIAVGYGIGAGISAYHLGLGAF